MIACNLCRNPVRDEVDPEVIHATLSLGQLVLQFYPNKEVNLCTLCYYQVCASQMEIWLDNLKADHEVAEQKRAELHVEEAGGSCKEAF